MKKLGCDTVKKKKKDPGEILSGKPKALLLFKGVNCSNANGEAM